MKRNFSQLMTLLALFPFFLAACSSGGGAGSIAAPTSVSTTSSTPTPAAPQTTPAPTIFIQANSQPPSTTASYSVTDAVMGAGSTGLPAATAGEGMTAVSITTDASGNFGRVTISFPDVTGKITTADFNLTAAATSQLSQVASLLKPVFGPFNDDAIALAVNQSAGGQTLSSSGFGLWAFSYENDSQGNGAGRIHAFAFGNLTPGAAVPASGSATYNGTTVGAGGAADDKTPNSLTALQGNAQIVANFSTQSVNSKLTNLTTQNLYTKATGTLPDLSGTAAMSGNAYSGPITGTGLSGSIKGNFYGSAAQETAGVWQASGGGINWMGSYGAK
jgi:hypothetical protein